MRDRPRVTRRSRTRETDDTVLSVWPVAQTPARAQRRGRYLPASVWHPARMLPALASQIITTYSQPGDLVIDPMAGIGTTLIEAIHARRDAIGVELEQHWVDIAADNIRHARDHGAKGNAQIHQADACALPRALPAEIGRAALVMFSPPYGRFVHGRVEPDPNGQGIQRWANIYTDRQDHTNLAHAHGPIHFTGLTSILAGSAQMLRPGGVLVVTARPWRHGNVLIDLPGQIITAAIDVGLVPVARHVALLAGIRESRLVPRLSFWAMHNHRNHTGWAPQHALAHEDILVFAADRAQPAICDLPPACQVSALDAMPAARRAVIRSPDSRSRSAA